jgi:RHS repeat-associated protein
MPQIPAGIALAQPGVGFGDMGGDGQVDLLVHAGPLQGFFETTADGTWQTFKRYDVFPSFELADPNVRLVDLTGDGLSDALMTGDQYFLWFQCLGEQGFAEPKRIARQYDLDTFPDVYFDDPAGRVRLADMTGDGLQDIVLVHNGSIDYWPNLGYGRFGKRLTMANAPRFDLNFDPKRLFLADLNGNGCADLAYVDVDRVSFWFNQCGNRWSERQIIAGTPRVSDVDSIQFADVFGTGTATLLWSYDFTGQLGGNYKALDFCGGIKPYVLTEMSNNMGATTRVRYAPSTKYFLEDQANGTPWVTKLPFPVQVVDKVEVIDHLSKTKLVTTYKYHHGYFDGREREFRGFGRVDQCDTETFEDFTHSSLHDGAALFTNNERAYHVPPVETRTWFHTGIYFAEDQPSPEANPFDFKELTKAFRTEFYQGDDQAIAVDDHKVETGATPHEAYRALRGAVLRTEVYARDGSVKAAQPYQVTDNRYQVHQVQPKHGNHHGVYFSSQIESVSYQYERNPTDPRISHALTLQVDAFGNPLKSLAIGYGRRQPDAAVPTPGDRDKQTQTFITYTENRYTNGIDDPIHDPDNYRIPLPSETGTYELTGFTPADNAKRFSVDEWIAHDFAQLNEAVEIQYEETADLTKTQKRLIEHVRTRYRKDDLSALLPVGALESLALPGESYKLAFTSRLLGQVYVRSGQKLLPANPADVLQGGGADRGGYVDLDSDGHWWIPSGRIFFSPGSTDPPEQELAYTRQHFFLPHRFRDPFHTLAVSTESVVTYDAYDLLMVETRDPVGNVVTVDTKDNNGQADIRNDYRVLQPYWITDPNGNRSRVAFDILGLVVGTAVMGKPLPAPVEGDSLDGFEADLTEAVMLDHLTNPLADPQAILRRATTRLVYDLFAFQRTQDQADPQPPVVYTLARETHDSDPVPVGGVKIRHGFSYSDGFGREIQKKMQAEPGPMPRRDAEGKIIVGADGQPVMTPNDVSPRWVGSGWTVFNNKGKPVRQYEPFFTDSHRFEFDVRIGVSPVLFYDPVERVVATLRPDHTWEKVVFDPWRHETWDINDTVLVADPKIDPDVGDFFSRLPDAEYFPTWHALRTDPTHAAAFAVRYPDPVVRTKESQAAEKTKMHADTPTVAHADALGRTFLTVAHNTCKYSNTPPADPPIEEFYRTRVIFDIEGNQRAVIDAKDRVVMRYDCDMLGNRIHQASMEAGERWMLGDVSGKPIYAWDSRGFLRHITYDALRRPTETFVTENNAKRLDARMVYGEALGDADNHRTRIFQVFDGAGVVTSEAYDFKGNLLRGRRDLLPNYQQAVDWQQNPVPNDGTFTSSTTYDALNRLTSVTAPDNSIYRPTYNEANLLDKVEVRAPAATTPFVTNINYDAKGQRALIAYRNGAQTHYEYDPLTFRLTRMRTTRPAGLNGLASQLFADPAVVQDLHYTYDPVGNITHIEDTALQTIIHNNEPIRPVCTYAYDAIYRLIEAQGREHIGQTAHDFTPPDGHRRDFDFAGLADFLAHPHDMQAMRNYTERYEYDPVGNFQFMRHSANGGGWTRDYEYDAASLIEETQKSNRLTKTTVGTGTNFIETYTYTDAQGKDVQGCITAINNMKMAWDSKDQLQQVDLGGGGTAYYVYDSGGQRVRKVIETQNGTRKQERIYLGGFEVYREYDGNGISVTLERETLHVMDDKQRIVLVETRTLDQGNDPAPPQLIRYQFSNHLGSVSLELDDHAQIISYEEYYPYGCTSYQAVRNQTETPKRYRYTGKERDEETGFAYYGLRYCALWLGRWISVDPASLRDGLNMYQFTRSNPVTLVDFSGTDSSRATQSDQTLFHHIENVIEERHTYDFFRIADRGGPEGKFDRAIVDTLVSIGEMAFDACDAKMNRVDLFDIGAQIVAKQSHLEREFRDAAERGEAKRTRNADRQLYMWSEGSISTRVERAAALERVKIQRMLQTLGNIEGGLGGTIGFAIAGDAGSDFGSTVDNILVATHGTLEARAANSSGGGIPGGGSGDVPGGGGGDVPGGGGGGGPLIRRWFSSPGPRPAAPGDPALAAARSALPRIRSGNSGAAGTAAHDARNYPRRGADAMIDPNTVLELKTTIQPRFSTTVLRKQVEQAAGYLPPGGGTVVQGRYVPLGEGRVVGDNLLINAGQYFNGAIEWLNRAMIRSGRASNLYFP